MNAKEATKKSREARDRLHREGENLIKIDFENGKDSAENHLNGIFTDILKQTYHGRNKATFELLLIKSKYSYAYLKGLGKELCKLLKKENYKTKYKIKKTHSPWECTFMYTIIVTIKWKR